MIPNSTHISCNFSSHTAAFLHLYTRVSKPPRSPTISKFCNHEHQRYLPLLPLKLKLKLKLNLNLNSNLHLNSDLKRKRYAGGALQCNNPKQQQEIDVESTKRDWSTSILLFVLWGALMYYVFMLAPNQTPSRDMYFLEKLLNLKGDDGFEMNQVLVSLWYIMGLWPLAYSMLLLPSGRSSNSKVPVWPFLVLSCFGGAYVLLPYFVLWKPPPPSVEEAEIARWPLNFLESKITAGILIAAGLGLITYAGLANADVWKEFYQYFRESKFIHATCLDFTLLSTFAPFWVYNDMSARKWLDKGSWLLPFTLIPFLGPAAYLVLRPPLSASPVLNEGE